MPSKKNHSKLRKSDGAGKRKQSQLSSWTKSKTIPTRKTTKNDTDGAEDSSEGARQDRATGKNKNDTTTNYEMATANYTQTLLKIDTSGNLPAGDLINDE
jgi:hypothetical protein